MLALPPPELHQQLQHRQQLRAAAAIHLLAHLQGLLQVVARLVELAQAQADRA
jgi:hypothetical protein